ncbi:MAG: hypothetical protein ACLSVD_00185 [Eggerthellaceae bacterium]
MPEIFNPVDDLIAEQGWSTPSWRTSPRTTGTAWRVLHHLDVQGRHLPHRALSTTARWSCWPGAARA